MKRFILTGAPGSGKTVVLRDLETAGQVVVEEAATDVIALWQAKGVAEPWMQPEFLDAVVALQKQRQLHVEEIPAPLAFFDRSPICTIALARYLQAPVSPALVAEVERLEREQIYEKKVFFMQNLGFIQNTAARRISFEETLRFERMHEEAYREHGYELVMIGRGTVAERAAAILKAAT